MTRSSDEARQLRNRQAALESTIARGRRDDDQGAGACLVTPIREPGDPWPPAPLPGQPTRWKVSAVSLAGPNTAGATLTATVAPAVFLATKVGGGTPPDPNAGDATTRLILLAERVAGGWFFEYSDGVPIP